jgi:hypothetical protein
MSSCPSTRDRLCDAAAAAVRTAEVARAADRAQGRVGVDGIAARHYHAVMQRFLPTLLAVLGATAVLSCGDTAGPVVRQPFAIQPVGGDGQTGAAGAALESAIVVRVEDATGQPVRGARVRFSVVSGGGRIVPTEVVTDDAGIGSANWTLGLLVEVEQQAAAVVTRSTGEPLRTTFSATALPTGPVAGITAIEPAVLAPGAELVITGTNLDHVSRITVAGVAVAVLGKSADALMARLPEDGFSCAPTTDAAIIIATPGGEVLRTRPLRIAAPRPLGAGEALLATEADPLSCVELPIDGRRYMIAVANVATDTAVRPGLRVRGVGAVAAPPAASAPATAPPASASTSSHARLLQMNTDLSRTLPAGPTAPMAAALQTDPAPGDTVRMRIPRLTGGSAAELCATYDSVLTRVVHVGTRVVVMEDLANPMAGSLDSLYRAVGEEFDQRQYDVLRENFAEPLRLGARVQMVFSRIVNVYNVSGFVWAGDLAPRSTCAQSNEAEVFYGYVPIAIGNEYGTGTRAEWYWTIRPTIVHEVKHIASMAERLEAGTAPEELWLEEATAMVAEELWARRIFGYEQYDNTRFAESIGCEIDGAFGRPPCVGRPSALFAHFLMLSAWMQEPASRSLLGPATAQDISHYGSGWLFLRWLLDHASRPERELLRELTTSTETGVSNVEARFDRPFELALPQWAAAVALDDRTGITTPAALRVPSWHLRDVFSGLNREQPNLFPTTFPLRVRTFGFGNVQTDVSMVRGGGAAFFELTGSWGGPQALAFEGAGGTPLPESLRVIIVRLE